MENLTNRGLRTTGDISVEVVTSIPQHSVVHVIVGPTGAGKSNFIEVFAAESQKLSISKDQLGGYTQQVTGYRLVNLKFHDYAIYLIDTPGFADTKISEIEILEMIRKWLLSHDIHYITGVFFLTPINTTRVSGSRRRTMDMLKALLMKTSYRSGQLGSLVFITTMWDTLHNERTQERAESNFVQLRDEVLKSFKDGGADIAKFRNTRQSAFALLDRVKTGYDVFSEGLSVLSPHRPNLYQDLHNRIEGALQVKKNIEFELAQPDTEDNYELRTILEKNHKDNQETLTKFVARFIKFGEPPALFEQAAEDLRKDIQADSDLQLLDSLYEEVFRLWEEGSNIPYYLHPNDFGRFGQTAHHVVQSERLQISRNR